MSFIADVCVCWWSLWDDEVSSEITSAFGWTHDSLCVSSRNESFGGNIKTVKSLTFDLQHYLICWYIFLPPFFHFLASSDERFSSTSSALFVYSGCFLFCIFLTIWAASRSKVGLLLWGWIYHLQDSFSLTAVKLSRLPAQPSTLLLVDNLLVRFNNTSKTTYYWKIGGVGLVQVTSNVYISVTKCCLGSSLTILHIRNTFLCNSVKNVCCQSSASSWSRADVLHGSVST